MLTNDRERKICEKYSARDENGKVRLHDVAYRRNKKVRCEMSRLTRKHESGEFYLPRRYKDENGNNIVPSNQDAINKLAHYEDMEEQGRFITLSCAVGDTVWIIGKNYNKCTNHYDCEHYDYDEYLIIWCERNCPNGFRGTGVIQAIIETIEINRKQVLVQLNAHDNYLRVPIASVFLTKKEAEAKLKEIGGGDCDSCDPMEI